MSLAGRTGRLTPRGRAIVTRDAQRVIVARHRGLRGSAALAAARNHVARVEKSLR